MKIYLAAFLAAFAASFVLTALLTPLLKRLKAGQYILGYVKEHKDKGGTPTMGGFAFITTVIVLAPAFYGVGNRTVNLTLVIVGGFMFVGFLDDFLKIYRKDNQGLRPYQKIVFQTAIAAIASVYCYMNGLTVLEIPFGSGIVLDIGAWVIPLTLFVFLATVNCVNLTDGLDGLAGGTGMAFLSVLGLLAAVRGQFCDIFSFLGAGALAAFLVFNTNKAALFMGDTGSLALGGLIACLCVFSGNTLYVPIIGITFVLSGISVIAQVIYYKRTGKRIFLMAPIHHHFQMKGHSECKISYVYALVTALTGFVCLLFV